MLLYVIWQNQISSIAKVKCTVNKEYRAIVYDWKILESLHSGSTKDKEAFHN